MNSPVHTSLQVVEIGALPALRAPMPDGPTVRTLPTATAGPHASGAAILQVSLSPGAGMPEHDHGPSTVTLIPLTGRVHVNHHGEQQVLSPGSVAVIDVGERVSLHNPHTDEATLLAVITPPDFAEAVADWPPATDPAAEPTE